MSEPMGRDQNGRLQPKNGSCTLKYVKGVSPHVLRLRTDENFTLDMYEKLIMVLKEAGIKISDKTIEILRSTKSRYSGTYDSNTFDGVERGYEELLNAMSPLISKYPLDVDVGYDLYKNRRIVISAQGEEPADFYLLGEDDDDNDHGSFDLRYLIEEDYLYPPRIILQNIILSLTKASKERNRKYVLYR